MPRKVRHDKQGFRLKADGSRDKRYASKRAKKGSPRADREARAKVRSPVRRKETAKAREGRKRRWTKRDRGIADAIFDLGGSEKRIAAAIGTTVADVLYQMEAKFVARREMKAAGDLPAAVKSPLSFTEQDADYACAMYSYGVPLDEIAATLECGTTALEEALGAQMRKSATKTNAMVAGFLFNTARSGNVQAQKFWLASRGEGWGDRKVVDVGGSAGVLLTKPMASDPSAWVAEHRKATRDAETTVPAGAVVVVAEVVDE